MLPGSFQVADFNSTLGGNKNVCKVCERTVAKLAHALRCSHCEVWVYVGCGESVEEDFVFMKNRSKHGCYWYCDACWGGPDAVGATYSQAGIKDRVEVKLLDSPTCLF